jgi:hypothetical protein
LQYMIAVKIDAISMFFGVVIGHGLVKINYIDFKILYIGVIFYMSHCY